MAVTAAKLNWKLGPANASGRNRSTTTAPTATNLRLIASRPSAIPPSTSSAATQLLIVGNLRSRDQGVPDAGDRACSRSNQDQVQAKGQPLAEG